MRDSARQYVYMYAFMVIWYL